MERPKIKDYSTMGGSSVRWFAYCQAQDAYIDHLTKQLDNQIELTSKVARQAVHDEEVLKKQIEGLEGTFGL